MWTRVGLKTKAKAHFKANYWPSVLAGVVLLLLGGGQRVKNTFETGRDMNINSVSATLGISPASLVSIVVGAVGFGLIISLLFKVFVTNPLTVGGKNFFMKNAHDSNTSLSQIIEPFKTNWMNVSLVMFMKNLFITLWTFVFVIPGVVKAYQYALVEFILNENPDIAYRDALDLSKEMTMGHKMDMFVLDLSFILWDLLGALTGGLVYIFYVQPYKMQTGAELYLTLKANRENVVF